MSELRVLSHETLLSRALARFENAGADFRRDPWGKLAAGLDCYDKPFGGLGCGLHILMGPPESGLTSVALQIALNVAERHGVPVVYLAWADRLEDLALRAAAVRRNAACDKVFSERAEKGPEGLACSGLLFIQGSRETSVQALGDYLNRQVGSAPRHFVSWLLIVDYLQVMGLVLHGTASSWAGLASLAFDLRSLAWEQEGVVLALSSLPRAAYQGTQPQEKRAREDEALPALPKGAGDLEYLADTMVLLENTGELRREQNSLCKQLELALAGIWWSREHLFGLPEPVERAVEETPEVLRRDYIKLRTLIQKPYRCCSEHLLLLDTVSLRVLSESKLDAHEREWCKERIPLLRAELEAERDRRRREEYLKKGWPLPVTLKPLPARLYGCKVRDLVPDASWSTLKASVVFEKWKSVLRRCPSLPDVPEPPASEEARVREGWTAREVRVDTKGKAAAFKEVLDAVGQMHPGRNVSEILTRVVVAVALEEGGRGPATAGGG